MSASADPPARSRLHGLKLLLDFAVLSLGQVSSKLVGFVAFAYMARALGPEPYGSVEYALGLFAFCTMVTEFGLGPIGVREIARDSNTLPAMASNVPLARLLIAALLVPVMLGAAYLRADSPTTQTLLLILATGLGFNAFRAEWLFQAREMMTWAAGGPLIRMLLVALGVALVIRVPGDAWKMGAVEVAAAGLCTLYYLFGQHYWITPVRLGYSRETLGYLLRQGATIGGGQLMSAINTYIPLILVANLASGEQTGWFGAAHRVVTSLSTFSMIYHFNLYPVLTRAVDQSGERLAQVVRASFRVVAWVSIGGALVMTVMRAELMALAFGSEFYGAGEAFGIELWFLPATLLSGHGRWMLIAAQRQRFVLYAQTAGAVAALAVGLPAVWWFGGAGAAISMVAGSLAVWATAQVGAGGVIEGMPGLLAAAGPLLLAGVALGLAPALGLSPWVSGPLSFAVFFALAPLLDRRLVPDFRFLVRAKTEGLPARGPDPKHETTQERP